MTGGPGTRERVEDDRVFVGGLFDKCCDKFRWLGKAKHSRTENIADCCGALIGKDVLDYGRKASVCLLQVC